VYLAKSYRLVLAKYLKNPTACYWKELAQYKVELHPYTVRKDALPEFFTDVNQMYDALLNKSGATGVFTDFPDTGVEFLKKQK
jgi:glycerophosphodiester phosphodiesterase